MILFVCIRCVFGVVVIVVDKTCCCCLQQSIPTNKKPSEHECKWFKCFLVIWNKLFLNILSRNWNRGNKSQIWRILFVIHHEKWSTTKWNEGPRATNVYMYICIFYNKHKNCFLLLHYFALIWCAGDEKKKSSSMGFYSHRFNWCWCLLNYIFYI